MASVKPALPAINGAATPPASGKTKATGSRKPLAKMWARLRRQEVAGKLPPEMLQADVAESFIPVPRTEITNRLSRPEVWPAGMAPDVKRLFRYLTAWRHIGYNELLDRLDSAYDLFSPDSDIRVDQTRTNAEIVATRADFMAKMRHLLVHANFKEIPRDTLDKVLTRDSEYGLDLHVDFDDYDEIMLYWRGTAERSRSKPANILFWRKITSQFPVYKRLFLLLKLKPKEVRIAEMMRDHGLSYKAALRQLNSRRKMLPVDADDDAVFLKIFKDIPLSDMEMMFPNTKVKFRKSDKVMISLSAGGSLGGVIAAPVLKLFAATSLMIMTPAAFGMLALALAGVGYRQFNSMINQRRQYMSILAQNLYFHTLADNRAALTLLASRAEEEDVKEDMLLYAMLAKEKSVHRSELDQIRQAIIDHLKRDFDVTVSFDAEEALGRLIKDGVVTELPDGTFRTMTPTEGIRHFDKLWDGYLNPDGVDRTVIDEM